MQTAVLARGILSVRRLSILPSHSGVSSRRMKLRSYAFQHQVGNHFSFWRGKVYLDIRSGQTVRQTDRDIREGDK